MASKEPLVDVAADAPHDHRPSGANNASTIRSGKHKVVVTPGGNSHHRCCGCNCSTLVQKVLVCVYNVVSMQLSVVSIRVWGEAAPQHAYFGIVAIIIGSLPLYAVLLLAQRRGWCGYTRKPATALDGCAPILRTSLFSGSLLAVNYIFTGMANPYVPGPTQVLMLQAALVPLTIFFCICIYCRCYKWGAWVAALIVFGATMVATWCSLHLPPNGNPSNCSNVTTNVQLNSTAGGNVVGDGGNGGSGWYDFLLFVGFLPLAILPSCFEGFHRVALRGETVTVMYRLLVTNSVVAILVVASFSAFGLTANELVTEFSTAFSCVFWGTGGITNATNITLNDDCFVARPALWVAVVSTAAQVHAQVLLSKLHSGVGTSMLLAVMPFTTDLVFWLLPCHAGRQYADVPAWSNIGCALAAFGGVVWFMLEESRANHRPVDESKFIQWFMEEKFRPGCCCKARGQRQ